LAFIIDAFDRETIVCPLRRRAALDQSRRMFAHEMNTANMELCACPAPRAGSSWRLIALP
jgi:hypothetical protein